MTPVVLSSCGKQKQQTIPIQSVELNKKTLSLILGDSYKLTATVLPEDPTNKNVIWRSSDENVAIVDQNGNVTVTNPKGISALTTITATTEIVDI